MLNKYVFQLLTAEFSEFLIEISKTNNYTSKFKDVLIQQFVSFIHSSKLEDYYLAHIISIEGSNITFNNRNNLYPKTTSIIPDGNGQVYIVNNSYVNDKQNGCYGVYVKDIDRKPFSNLDDYFSLHIEGKDLCDVGLDETNVNWESIINNMVANGISNGNPIKLSKIKCDTSIVMNDSGQYIYDRNPVYYHKIEKENDGDCSGTSITVEDNRELMKFLNADSSLIKIMLERNNDFNM